MSGRSKREVRTRAFVLRTVEYGDADLIVTMLGRDTGKFSAMARSARKSKKRFPGGLGPMRSLEATVTFRANRDLAHLSESTVVRDYRGLEESFERITVASYATELVRHIVREGDDAAGVFDLLDDLYDRIGDAEQDATVLQVVLHHFELSLLRLCGAAPSLLSCHRCGRPHDAFDVLRCLRSGVGLVCAGCLRDGESYGVLEPGTLEVLHYLEVPDGDAPPAIAEPERLEQARRVVDSAIHHLIDAPMKSRAMLDAVLGALEPETS